MLDARKFSAVNLLVLLSTIMLLLQGTPVFAQIGTPNPTDDEINAVARKLYCPVCENIPLDVCSTQACAQWRDLIREKLNLGWTQDQIIAYFAEQYGDRVLATPPVRDAMSINILAYIIPFFAFIVGIIVVIHYIKRKKSVSLPDAAITVDTENPEIDIYLKRMEEEVRRDP